MVVPRADLMDELRADLMAACLVGSMAGWKDHSLAVMRDETKVDLMAD